MSRPVSGWQWVGEVACLVALVLVAVYLLSGCGSALRTHAAAVTIARATLDSGGDAIMDARAADLDACHDSACLDAGEARWSPWVASLRLVVEAWATWRDAVVEGFGLPDEGIAAAACAVALRHLLALWTALAEVLTSAGVDVPDLPAAVVGVLGGES
jgi:uncharacterized protein YceK